MDGVELDTEAFKKWKPDYANAEFILEDGKYICGVEVEKMSKSHLTVSQRLGDEDREGMDWRAWRGFIHRSPGGFISATPTGQRPATNPAAKR